MTPLVRFSPLVRKGLKFKRRFETAKQSIANNYEWYPYDSFANLFYLQTLINKSGLSLDQLTQQRSVLDIGAADGALSFFLESLGLTVESWDNSPTNINRMAGLRDLAAMLRSAVTIRNVDLDAAFEMSRSVDLCVLLGILYHLKNPFYALEKLASHAAFCFLSTRIARQSADGSVNFENVPIAYLLDAEECNNDATNFWIFSPAGLTRLVHRAGWDVCASVTAGTKQSMPASLDSDERMFLLLRSRHI